MLQWRRMTLYASSALNLNFDFIGFHQHSDSPTRHFAESRRIRDILRESDGCAFCKRIADLCRRWKSRKYGDLATLRFEEAEAAICTYERGSLDADDIGQWLASNVYLHVYISVEKPEPFPGYCGPTAHFQRCGLKFDTPNEFLNGTTKLDDVHIEPYSARLRPLLADLRFFRKWKEICCKEHQKSCASETHPADLILRLIDVEQHCVISNCHNLPYVALSYVWGQDTQPCLTKATESSFQQPDALREGNLPATIFDAFSVTKALGERYLWVDSCCIVQDDDFDKLKYVPIMDLI